MAYEQVSAIGCRLERCMGFRDSGQDQLAHHRAHEREPARLRPVVTERRELFGSDFPPCASHREALRAEALVKAARHHELHLVPATLHRVRHRNEREHIPPAACRRDDDPTHREDFDGVGERSETLDD
jgi:hypothetical protein